ncbi:MAG: STAS/SEC14 domain-containing protein [Polyangiaceae bacterium]|nr:STAS/SEC14 domain-containing protein [Polyangiaceae bacterium]
MGSIRIDDDRTGMLVVTFVGTVSDDEFKRYLDEVGAPLQRRAPYAVVLDARASDRTPAVQRKLQADWLTQHRSELARYCVGNAFVITSPLVRGVLTAILWLQPLPVPYVVCSSLEAARKWARDRLAVREPARSSV